MRASSSRPGFSYLVGVTDNVNNKLRNLSDAASWGAHGTSGVFPYALYLGGTCAGAGDELVGGKGDCVRVVLGAGDLDALGALACSSNPFNLLVNNNCSNCLDKSPAEKSNCSSNEVGATCPLPAMILVLYSGR